MPVKTEALLAEVRARVPELPKAKRARFVEQYEVSPYDAGVLADDLALASYFETAAKGAQKPKNVANWILNDLQNALGAAGKAIDDCPIPPAALDELVNLIDSGKISGKQAKEVFAEMFASGKTAAAIVKEKGIEQLSDTGAIEALCDQVIAANPKPVADFKAGNVASLNFLKGQVMKLSQGQSESAAGGRNSGAETESVAAVCHPEPQRRGTPANKRSGRERHAREVLRRLPLAQDDSEALICES